MTPYAVRCYGGLSGRPLRYRLCLALRDARAALTVAEIVALIERDGLPIRGRRGKTVSDTLRWQVKRGRLARVGRSRYCYAHIPESTQRYMRLWIETHPVEIVAETLRTNTTPASTPMSSK